MMDVVAVIGLFDHYIKLAAKPIAHSGGLAKHHGRPHMIMVLPTWKVKKNHLTEPNPGCKSAELKPAVWEV